MTAEPDPPQPPRVVAVLVVTDGAEWLPGLFATLARARYPALELVAVDNASTDASPELLAKRLEPGQILRLPTRTGFGRAVAAALTQFDALADCDYVLLLHDDLVLAPGALINLVTALEADDTVGIVGPKLREWSSDRLLQQVGMTIDRLGRAESPVEVGELDQGQHDAQMGVLYVSTAGMLLRRTVFRDVGGFDVRYPVFRDDLDLCWRAWLAGVRVEVVPAAVGYHIAAAARGARKVGGGRDWDPRYLAERHTLATLLKNYGALRLLLLLPVVGLVGIVKLLGFLATRRFGDALATVAAYAWNIAQLPQTLRRRSQVQRRRSVSDSELARLFAPGLPRLRSYAEALGSWLAGGSTRALIDDSELEDASAGAQGGMRAFLRGIKAHPAAAAAGVLLLCYLLGLIPLLGPGQIVGGEVAPWPERATAFFSAYANPWNADPLGSAYAASPLQAVLGLVSLAGFGSAWLAQRLFVLGLLPLTWLLSVRAGRLVTVRTAPRALGATLYVISPLLLGAFAQGRLSFLLVAAVMPGLLIVGVRAADGEAPAAGSWRVTALLALGLAVTGAADPTLLPLPALLLVALLLYSVIRPRPGRWVATRRLGLAALAAGALLSPWLVGLASGGWRSLAVQPVVETMELWRALSIVPDLLPGVGGPAGWLVALTSVAVALAALLLGVRARPGVVAGLLLVWVLAAIGSWGLSLLPPIGFWPPALLLPAAIAQAGLAVLAARWLEDGLGAYAFGLRQVVTATAAVVLLVGLGGGMLRLAAGPWSDLARDPELVPAFVTGDMERVGPYRVLLLVAGEDGRVRWDVTGSTGPSMTSYGAIPSPSMVARLDAAVGALAGGTDPAGGAALGVSNIRYVVVGDPGAGLQTALDRQPQLEPLPSGGARVYRVRSWLPRAVVLPEAVAGQLIATGDPGDATGLEEAGLGRRSGERWVGTSVPAEGGLLVLSEGRNTRWEATASDESLDGTALDGVNAFVVPAGVERVEVAYSGARAHLLLVGAQLLLALAVLSVALRPPGTAAGRGSPGELTLPEELEGEDPAPPTPVRTGPRHLAPADDRTPTGESS